MGQLDTEYTGDTYETRELAWELQQSHADNERIRYLMDTGANLRSALQMAKISVNELSRNPHFKSLQLQKRLETIN